MSWAIWITGAPGCGKTTIARAVAKELASRGIGVKLLEMDRLRQILTPEPTYKTEERELVYRALVLMAKLLTEAKVPVIIDATGHRRAWRELARSLIPIFAEVQLTCPVEICTKRERARPLGYAPPGVYTYATRPGATVPGVNVPYEVAVNAELVVNTHTTSVPAAVQEILYLARRLHNLALLRPYRVGPTG